MNISEGLSYAGIGILIVFLVLTIIMAVLYLFKLIFAKKEKPKTTPVIKKQVINEPETQSISTTLSNKISEKKLVAIATSAIAASRGESDCAFSVISINKIS